jgi:hypothetical protein
MYNAKNEADILFTHGNNYENGLRVAGYWKEDK